MPDVFTLKTSESRSFPGSREYEVKVLKGGPVTLYESGQDPSLAQYETKTKKKKATLSKPVTVDAQSELYVTALGPAQVSVA